MAARNIDQKNFITKKILYKPLFTKLYVLKQFCIYHAAYFMKLKCIEHFSHDTFLTQN